MSESLIARKPALHAVLRVATAAAHARLETRLALLEPPYAAARYLRILQGFWGFHRVWEQMLAEQAELAPLLAGRSRMAALERDLFCLGMTPAEREALPLCLRAHELGGSATRLLGGIYVLEGSTLGGQVITQALRDQDWLPEDGLHYFNPYGPQTGAMWRRLREALDAVAGAAAQAELVDGARDTFALLHSWLGDGLSQ